MMYMYNTCDKVTEVGQQWQVIRARPKIHHTSRKPIGLLSQLLMHVSLKHTLTTPREGPNWGARPPPPPLFLLIIFLIFIVGSSLPKVQAPSSPISLASLAQLATIRLKNLTKNNRSIHNVDCILAKKLLYHQKTMFYWRS